MPPSFRNKHQMTKNRLLEGDTKDLNELRPLQTDIEEDEDEEEDEDDTVFDARITTNTMSKDLNQKPLLGRGKEKSP